ncbi:MAG: DUF4340 domain-containing protein [Chloroflexota bacterium]|nr:DUF4340 domain-containing protein [Chloroflexota bacterium]
MNVRLTIMLILALALVGGFVYFNQINKPSKPADERPLFYKVEMDDIAHITIESGGNKVAFTYTADRTWVFDDAERTPVAMDRFAGTTLLLSGPRAERLVQKQMDDPAKYGLDKPLSTIEVKLKNGRTFTLYLGNFNVDGSEQYAQLAGSPGLYLVVTSWTSVVTRFANDPPVPTPEPTFPPEETPTPAGG